MRQTMWISALFLVACGSAPASQTISLTGFTIDPERSVAARTGKLAALFGPSGMTGPCWDQPCDNDASFMLAKLGNVRVSLFGHPEISTTSDANGMFKLDGVPAKAKVNIQLDRPGDPIYIATIDGITIRTGTVEIKNLPFHVCRNDKIWKALLDFAGANALDNGAVLAVINNNVPLPQNGPLNNNITVSADGGKVAYVGFDYMAGSFVVDEDPTFPSYSYASWLGAVIIYNAEKTTVALNVLDTTPNPDPVTQRPYTYPVYTLPLAAHSSTFLLLYPIGTGT